MSWQYVALLVGALLLMAYLSFQQQRAYQAVVRDLSGQHSGPQLSLVSGRGKGWLRGSVVVLVVDRRARRIIDAREMQGSTNFARFKDAPYLLGNLADAGVRSTSTHTRKAVTEALALLPKGRS
ncbi:transcriptional regulator [Micrococcales bacterium 31B]|nr:transcriptional regulator [Micrococcales bacterium 31B]